MEKYCKICDIDEANFERVFFPIKGKYYFNLCNFCISVLEIRWNEHAIKTYNY